MIINLKIFVSALLFLVFNLFTQNIANAAEKQATDKTVSTSIQKSEVPVWEDVDELYTGKVSFRGEVMPKSNADAAVQEEWSMESAKNEAREAGNR